MTDGISVFTQSRGSDYPSPVRVFQGLDAALLQLMREAGIASPNAWATMAKLSSSIVKDACEGRSAPNSRTLDALLSSARADVHDLARALDEVNGRAAAPGSPQEYTSAMADPAYLIATYPDASPEERKRLQRAVLELGHASRALDLAVAEMSRYKKA